MKLSAFVIGIALVGGSLAYDAGTEVCEEYADYLHWAGGMAGSGPAYRVAASGSHAYVASAGLQIVDITDPRDLHVVGSAEVPVQDVAVAGDYAFVASWSAGLPGLVVIDVAQPEAPVIVGSVGPFPSGPMGVAVSGGYAYVAMQSGLVVIDVSDPRNPHAVGRVQTPGEARSVAVSGNYAYVANLLGRQLQVIDVASPVFPRLVGRVATMGFPADVAVAGNYAYVATIGSDGTGTPGLEVIDVRHPANPRSVGRAATPDAAWGVEVAGARAYLASSLAGLQVLDVADPRDPRIVGTVHTGMAWDVTVSGDHAYVGGTSSWVLQAIDVRNSENASIVGSLSLPDEPYGLALTATHAVVADRTAGLQIVDVTDPGTPHVVAALGLFWSIGVAVSGRFAYVTAGYGPRSLVVVDLAEPLHPQIVGQLTMPDWSMGVAVAGNYAFVADSYGGLAVVDVTDPRQPVLVGGVAMPFATAVAVSGTHAYVTNTYGIQVVDVSDPLHPEIVGATDTPAARVAVADPYAYATTAFGLQVIDVANPEEPRVVGEIRAPGPAEGVAVSGGYAYVASRGVQVFDVTDPQEPWLVGSVGAGTGDWGDVAISDGRVFFLRRNAYRASEDRSGSAGVEAALQIALVQCPPPAAGIM